VKAGVTVVLDRIVADRGAPQSITVDNGTEFAGKAVDLWAYQNAVHLDFIRPGRPVENGYIESFNGTLRAECLDAHWFGDLAEARQRIESWRIEYNASRPHRALGERTPNEFAREIAASRDLSDLQTSRKLTLELV
jgi:putative transposase